MKYTFIEDELPSYIKVFIEIEGHQESFYCGQVSESKDPNGKLKTERAIALCNKYISSTPYKSNVRPAAIAADCYFKDKVFSRRYNLIISCVRNGKTDYECEQELALEELSS